MPLQIEGSVDFCKVRFDWVMDQEGKWSTFIDFALVLVLLSSLYNLVCFLYKIELTFLSPFVGVGLKRIQL